MLIAGLSFFTVLAAWCGAAALLAWSGLPARWRRALALGSSLLGLVFLVLALGSEGLRETESTAVFLLGTPYVTASASASASLPYYVLTGLCLMLGTAGLAISDRTAAALWDAWASVAVATGWLVILIRFLLEKAAAPEALAHLFGVTWLAPLVGGFFWLRLRESGRGIAPLCGYLLLYSLAVRGPVAALYFVATRLRLGSHYDVYSVTTVRAPWGAVYHFEPGSLSQVLNLGVIPQFAVWPIYTLLSGLLGAATVSILVSSWRHSAKAEAGPRSSFDGL